MSPIPSVKILHAPRIPKNLTARFVTNNLAGLEGMDRKVPNSQSGEQGFVEFTTPGDS